MKPLNPQTKRIGIVVVHGVGAQRHFQHLETIASNLFKALQQNPERQAHIQIRRGTEILLHGETENWQEAPVVVSWRPLQGNDGTRIEVVFREVHWADLDMPVNLWNWTKFIFWALGASGVMLFKASHIWSGRKGFMRLPHSGLKWWCVPVIRMRLFGVSLLFFLMLISVELLQFILRRLSLRVTWLANIHAVVYDYLGDVKLYQDWFVRHDSKMETLGEKSRVAIRRRVVRALVQTAVDVEAGRLDGYFVFAHSLGTVAAFNGLMELGITLPNYFGQEEWKSIPGALKTQQTEKAADAEQPRRPYWLTPNDALDRARLFSGLRGFLTMGSPLDKFAALWPVIVPVNEEPIPNNAPWINVSDAQDIVASTIDLFESHGSTVSIGGVETRNIGGLQLHNIDWVDQPWLFSAHTSYWKQTNRADRLINGLIPWLEGNALVEPANRYARWLARVHYVLSFAFIGIVLAIFPAVVLWLIQAPITFPETFSLSDALGLIVEQFVKDLSTIPSFMFAMVFGGVVIVLICAVMRHAWERALSMFH